MREEIIQFSYEKLLPSVDLQALKIDIELLEARRFFAGCNPIRGIMRYYDATDVIEGQVGIRGEQIHFGDSFLKCEVLKEFASCQVKSALAYLITCSPESRKHYPIGEINYHFIQNACMDLARNMILENCRKYTYQEQGKQDSIWTTKILGPGYYGMPLEEGRKLHRLLNGERIGVTYQGTMMTPLRSSIGFAFSYEAEQQVVISPCDYCMAAVKECNYCGGRA